MHAIRGAIPHIAACIAEGFPEDTWGDVDSLSLSLCASFLSNSFLHCAYTPCVLTSGQQNVAKSKLCVPFDLVMPALALSHPFVSHRG